MILIHLVLLEFVITLAYHSAQSQLVHAQYSKPGDGKSLSHQSNSTVTQCPSVWYKFNQTTQNCQCIPFNALTCDGKHAYVNTRHILTYDSANNRICSQSGDYLIYNMKYKHLNVSKDGHHVLLPDNISELNQYTCGPMNRMYDTCIDCKNGYGPAIIPEPASCSNMCYICKDTWYKLLLYLLIQFIPITVFCLLILAFQIRLTSAPMTCFIMYSQLIVLALYEDCNRPLLIHRRSCVR